MWRFKVIGIVDSVASHPIVLLNIRGHLGWSEIREIILLPVLGWPLIFLYYIFALKSRVSILLGSCLIMVAYPVATSLVARDIAKGTSSTAAIGYFSIPWGVIFPALILIHILDSLGKWLVSYMKDRRLSI